MTASFNPIVSLTTDFGRSDGYVGTMKGVILTICPSAKITDLTHLIPPQDIWAAAFVLYQSFTYYPNYTVHCVVVDPGVGSERRAVAIQTEHGLFVGPDNGVFGWVLKKTKVVKAISLTNPIYQLKKVSATFHGRDIFAPAAARLAAGVPISDLGDPVTNLVELNFGEGLPQGQGQIIHVDHFGNLVLDITSQDVQPADSVSFGIAGQTVLGISRTFADVAEGELLAYVGSTHDHLEIAVRNGNAAETLGLRQGDTVQVDINAV